MSPTRWILVAIVAAGSTGNEAVVHAANPLLAWELAAHADDETSGRAVSPSRDERTPYVAGIIGSSMDAETNIASGRLPLGDAAIGVSLPRPAGAVRLELEGRQRTALSGNRTVRDARADSVPVNIDAEWTTMANAWRDVAVGEHVALYAGGGGGAGGYRASAVAEDMASSQVTDVAWQVGGGATFAITDRVTLDAGYRYYGIGTDRAVEPAGEVVFAVRVADPFRGWLQR